MTRRTAGSAVVRFFILLLLVLSFGPAESTAQPAVPRQGSRASIAATKAPLVEAIRSAAHRIVGSERDYDPLLQLIGEARIVLLGEASHGTHDFYRERTRITQRLVQENGFSAVAIEGDWPDADRVNRFVRGTSNDSSAEQALSSFQRFPTWMWGNTDVRDFVTWLRKYNEGQPAGAARVGFYGLDLYSMSSSAEAVIRYLESTDPDAAQRARERYECMLRFRDDPVEYTRSVLAGNSVSCEQSVKAQLEDVEKWAADRMEKATPPVRQELFSLLQNARVVKNAEEYYRTLPRGGVFSWNLRDRHMAETVETVTAFLQTQGSTAKVVIWAHNSHVGDARATELGEAGEWNIGQLMRERYGTQTALVGFTTYTGTVMAASAWDAPGEVKQVRPSLSGSYGALFHETRVGDFLLLLRGELVEPLSQPMLERAIGVVYLPETERVSHYFQARLSRQFDAIIHLDETRAVEPLPR
jgi:erythromycin esterase-like protein